MRLLFIKLQTSITPCRIQKNLFDSIFYAERAFFDEYIDRPKLTEQKKHLSIYTPPPPHYSGSEQ